MRPSAYVKEVRWGKEASSSTSLSPRPGVKLELREIGS